MNSPIWKQRIKYLLFKMIQREISRRIEYSCKWSWIHFYEKFAFYLLNTTRFHSSLYFKLIWWLKWYNWLESVGFFNASAKKIVSKWISGLIDHYLSDPPIYIIVFSFDSEYESCSTIKESYWIIDWKNQEWKRIWSEILCEWIDFNECDPSSHFIQKIEQFYVTTVDALESRALYLLVNFKQKLHRPKFDHNMVEIEFKCSVDFYRSGLYCRYTATHSEWNERCISQYS